MPQPETLVKKNAQLDDTINLIVSRINTDFNTPYIAGICEKYNAADPDRLAFLERLQDYVYRNVKYVLDVEPKEVVTMPTTTILRGKGDCKKMTVIIGSVLRHANIPFCIKHIFYWDVDFTHVYIIVPYPNAKGYITVDPVENPYFDNEVRNIKKANVYDKNGNKMDLYTGATTSGSYRASSTFAEGSTGIMNDLSEISGIGCMSGLNTMQYLQLQNILFDDSTISGIGRKTKEERKERRQKVLNKFKEVGLEEPRAAFLALVRVNALKLATTLVRSWNKNPAAVTNMWQKVGGNIDELKKIMAAGAKQTVSYRTGVVVAATVAAAIVTATPIIIAAQKLFDELKTQNDEDKKALDDATDKAEDTVADPKTTPVKLSVLHKPLQQQMQIPPRNGVPDGGGGGGSAGGDSFGEIDTWTKLLYSVFRSLFYCGLPFLFCSNKYSFALSCLLTVGSFYYLCIKQKFLSQQISLLINNKIETQ